MAKTDYMPAAGLPPLAGETPVGLQHRLKSTTGPYIARSIPAGEGGVLLVTYSRGDATGRHTKDGIPIQREDLVPCEVYDLAGDDLQTAYELIPRLRAAHERDISVAAGYDGTTVTPAAQGPAVHADADGTVLTPQEVAARQGLDAGPSLEEALAWWDEQSHIEGPYEDAVPSEIAALVGRIPLNEVEYVAALENADEYEGAPAVGKAISARLLAHAEAVAAPGWSPLEDGLPIAEARSRIANQGDVRVVLGWLEAEAAGKGRKRLLEALRRRVDELDNCEGLVGLTIYPEERSGSDETISRSLLPAEAREVAAALVHHAREVEQTG